ncbi:MAG: tetratricopeptide repeat protein [Chitinophagaceae bacterium]|nr:tetratricopeptide repeat protein [Chitinophagaceae bacterium]MDP1764000.1 tetratricopeptide repeat protein [Sediminibacterium sp.]MDP1809885.1 tetratricopeptide repeat protein [Sediminibacterium sp.]MDP3126897.1 tetratricopeptide repeat protein [Sediminibacterium sp.]MDP3665946.1 tetratricopeptide repeat protein [Sediminibacterium sp.]
MRENPYREDREELKELLKQYQNLKTGRSHSFLEEDAFERIIDHFDEKDDLPEALEASEIGLSQFPYSSQLMIKKADLLLASRKYKDALQVLELAELYDGSDVNLYILKTDAYLALDQQAKAVELLEAALGLFEGEERLDLLFELADVYDDYEEFDKVFDCLKLILEEEPNNEEALYKICFWTDFTGRNEESITLHQQIIEEFPFSELAWFNLAAAYQGLKLYEKSIDAYQYAVAIDEKFDYAYRNMGDAYLRLRKYKEAIEVLEKVLELTRPEDVIYEAIGHCFHRMGNYAQARFHYKKAVHLNPDDSKLHYKIAVTYMLEEQWQSAVKQLENAMRIHRAIPEYNLAMGECRMNLLQYKEAIQYFGTVVRNKPKNVAGWEALISCLIKAEFYDEAIEQCKASMKATEGKPVFLFYYSTILFALGKSKDALQKLELAMEKAPKLLKKFIELNPSILQNNQVVDIVARYKKGKKI